MAFRFILRTRAPILPSRRALVAHSLFHSFNRVGANRTRTRATTDMVRDERDPPRATHERTDDPFDLLAPIARAAKPAVVDADAARDSARDVGTTRATTTTPTTETTETTETTTRDERAVKDIVDALGDVLARVRALESIAREGFVETSRRLETLTRQVASLSERVESLARDEEEEDEEEAYDEPVGEGGSDEEETATYEEPTREREYGRREERPRRRRDPPPRGREPPPPPPHAHGPHAHGPHGHGPPPHGPPPHGPPPHGPPSHGPPPHGPPPHGPPPHGPPAHGHGGPPPPHAPPPLYNGRYDSPSEEYPTAYPAYAPPEPPRPAPPPAPTSPGAVPLENMIVDFANMGFTRQQVLAVVGEIASTGQKIEVNTVLDKLMRTNA